MNQCDYSCTTKRYRIETIEKIEWQRKQGQWESDGDSVVHCTVHLANCFRFQF